MSASFINRRISESLLFDVCRQFAAAAAVSKTVRDTGTSLITPTLFLILIHGLNNGL